MFTLGYKIYFIPANNPGFPTLSFNTHFKDMRNRTKENGYSCPTKRQDKTTILRVICVCKTPNTRI